MEENVASLFDPVDVDTLSVEMVADVPGLFTFRVELSGRPDLLWKRTFYRVWKESRYLGKLEATVLNESICFVCRQSQIIEDYLYFIECRIGETNRRMNRYWTSRGFLVETARSGWGGMHFLPSY